jgi:Peptidyl-tRNA hydrolase PTH2
MLGQMKGLQDFPTLSEVLNSKYSVTYFGIGFIFVGGYVSGWCSSFLWRKTLAPRPTTLRKKASVTELQGQGSLKLDSSNGSTEAPCMGLLVRSDLPMVRCNHLCIDPHFLTLVKIPRVAVVATWRTRVLNLRSAVYSIPNAPVSLGLIVPGARSAVQRTDFEWLTRARSCSPLLQKTGQVIRQCCHVIAKQVVKQNKRKDAFYKDWEKGGKKVLTLLVDTLAAADTIREKCKAAGETLRCLLDPNTVAETAAGYYAGACFNTCFACTATPDPYSFIAAAHRSRDSNDVDDGCHKDIDGVGHRPHQLEIHTRADVRFESCVLKLRWCGGDRSAVGTMLTYGVTSGELVSVFCFFLLHHNRLKFFWFLYDCPPGVLFLFLCVSLNPLTTLSISNR